MISDTDKDDLIADIETDKEVARKSLDRPAYTKFTSDGYFTHDTSKL